MMNPVLLEVLANEIVSDRLQQATHAALLDQLPHPPRAPRPARAARHHLATALRGLACKLDPSASREPTLAAAHPR